MASERLAKIYSNYLIESRNKIQVKNVLKPNENVLKGIYEWSLICTELISCILTK